MSVLHPSDKVFLSKGCLIFIGEHLYKSLRLLLI